MFPDNKNTIIFATQKTHIMTATTTQRVKNYQGNNSFVLKMKDSLNKWGSLTTKQEEAVEKCLNSEIKVIDMDNLPEDIKKILNYTGSNTFVKDIAEKFRTYGTLTDRQKSVATSQIKKEEDKDKTIQVKWPTPGETIKMGRKIGQELKDQYGLEFNPILIDITKVLSITPKAIKFSGKLTSKRAKVCICCMKTLTDEFSMLTNLGKICAKRLGVDYITNKDQAGEFRERYLKRIDEIGEMEFWVPKSQIVKWEGIHEQVIMDWIKFD